MGPFNNYVDKMREEGVKNRHCFIVVDNVTTMKSLTEGVGRDLGGRGQPYSNQGGQIMPATFLLPPPPS